MSIPACRSHEAGIRSRDSNITGNLAVKETTMSSAADRMLIATLSMYANFSEKRLLKNGELGECAANMVRRRRMFLRILWVVFFFSAYVPFGVQIVGKIFYSSASSPADAFILTMGVLASMGQLTILLEARVSLAKLEMMIAVWKLSKEETSDVDVETAVLECLA